ncbi:NACHT domain-containing protein, partial [Actinomadura xylanilytica]|uniref:NACHT domain-containing protein n=1 Tax=Actinomadura xylanilytica TaxID=887459 RepID=UPI00255B1F41
MNGLPDRDREQVRTALGLCFDQPPARLVSSHVSFAEGLRAAVAAQLSPLTQMVSNDRDARPFYDTVTVAPQRLEDDLYGALIRSLRRAAAGSGVAELVRALDTEGISQRLDEILRRVSPSVPDGDVSADFMKVRREYLERLLVRHRRVDLEILTPLTEQGEHPVMLLGKVFIPQSVREDPPPMELLDLPREVLLRLSAEGEPVELPGDLDRARLERARRAYRERSPRPVLDALAQSRQAVVLGDPGSGKSTLSRYVMLALAATQTAPDDHSWAVEAVPADWRGRLPLLVELRTYADPHWRGKTFLDLIDTMGQEQHLGLPKGLLEEFLHTDGHALVVFDGLDEIFDPRLREEVSRQIEGFAARYPRVRVIVTSRVKGYSRAVLDAAGFTTYMIQDLDRPQIEEFTKTWYGHSCPDDAAHAARLLGRLLKAVNSSAAVAELAGNPMLLTILAIIARRRELPRERREVYRHAVTVLIEHWDVNKHLMQSDTGTPYLDAEDKLLMLHCVARRMQDAPAGLAGNHIPGRELTEEFEAYLSERFGLARDRAVPAARAMLRQFQHRNFILSSFGAGLYGFVHRAFLEYLAADDIRQRFTDRTLSEDDLLALFDTHAPDPAWSEVLLLLIGVIPEQFAIEAIRRLITTDPHWAARSRLPLPRLLALRALGEIRRHTALAPHAATITPALTHLLRVAANREDSFDSALSTALDRALPASFQRPEWLDTPQYQVWYQASKRTLSGIFTTQTAQNAATLFVLTHSGDRTALRDRVANDENWAVRQAAVEAVARGWPEDSDTLAWLRDRVANDEDGAVRQAAVQAIAHGWPENPDTLSLLRDRAVNDENEDVRYAAVQAVARGWLEDSDTLSLLRDRAVNDENEDVRRVAVQAVARGWLEDSDTLSLLRDRAVNDENEDVRRVAVQAVARGWLEDSDTLSLLRDRAVNDENEDVRRVAVQAVARGWLEDSDTLSLLR